MKAVTVLFAGNLKEQAFVPLENTAKCAFGLALERARLFPSVEKLVVLGLEGVDYPELPPETHAFSLIRAKNWTRRQVLEAVSRVQAGYDLVYFAWADCPFLDPALTAALTERHTQYAAEYSYADGYPYGFAPELLAPGIAGILFNIDTDGEIPVQRDALFQVIQKDINSFDIETEISPVDLRLHRLRLAADSKRNLLLINRWLAANGAWHQAEQAAELIEKRPDILRTLPAFYNIQVSGACPQSCSYCPYPNVLKMKNEELGMRNVTTPDSPLPTPHSPFPFDYMDKEKFQGLLDKIVDFSSDAVISLSLFGEVALHPDKIDLVKMVLERPSLSLVIETSGIGWKSGELESLAALVQSAPKRTGLLESPLSWIVSLDAFDANRYKEIRGPGFAEAVECVKQLFTLFPGKTYVQAVRVKGAEDDIEAFYRYWKDAAYPAKKGSADHVIIQKYDDFCGKLPKLQASDLSPVKRRPCWHVMRDINIALDGTVLQCREDVDCLINKNIKPRSTDMQSMSLRNTEDASQCARNIEGVLEKRQHGVRLNNGNSIDEGRKPNKESMPDSPCTSVTSVVNFSLNVFNNSLNEIWEAGKDLYLKHCAGVYPGMCADCDEYYTYNF